MNEFSDEAGGGAISITVHTHSSAFRGPRDAPTLAAETVPLRHPITQQRFRGRIPRPSGTSSKVR